jgi:predicted dehydrogenase
MQQTTRIGFFGAGYSAGRHLDALLTFEDANVVAVIDSDGERARAFASRCGGTPYASAEEMLDRERLDAVYICVPPFAHGVPEAAAIERGLPFFVEKPLAVDLATAEAIVERVAAEGLVTATGYHWRYLDTTERAQELLSQKPARLALGYWLDVIPPTQWWVTEALSGGQIVEQLTHILDLARLLVGEVKRVYAVSARTENARLPNADVCDVSAATLHFTSGAIGTMASTCLLNWRHVVGLHLICEGMVIELTEYDMVIDVGEGRPIQEVEVDAFAREDRDFIDAVRGKQNRIRVPYAEALTTHRLAIAVAQAAREGRALALRPEAGYA